eukprot:3277380-Rhodomonas_salina.1
MRVDAIPSLLASIVRSARVLNELFDHCWSRCQCLHVLCVGRSMLPAAVWRHALVSICRSLCFFVSCPHTSAKHAHDDAIKHRTPVPDITPARGNHTLCQYRASHSTDIGKQALTFPRLSI